MSNIPKWMLQVEVDTENKSRAMLEWIGRLVQAGYTIHQVPLWRSFSPKPESNVQADGKAKHIYVKPITAVQVALQMAPETGDTLTHNSFCSQLEQLGKSPGSAGTAFTRLMELGLFIRVGPSGSGIYERTNLPVPNKLQLKQEEVRYAQQV